MNTTVTVALVSLVNPILTAGALLWQNKINNSRDENVRSHDAAERERDRESTTHAGRVARRQLLQDQWRNRRAEAYLGLISAFREAERSLKQGAPGESAQDGEPLMPFGDLHLTQDNLYQIDRLLTEISMFGSLVAAMKAEKTQTSLLQLVGVKLRSALPDSTVSVGDWRAASHHVFDTFHDFNFAARADIDIPDFRFANDPDN